MAQLAAVLGGLAALLVAVSLAHWGWQHVRYHRDCRRAGEKIYRETADLYRGAHDYRVAPEQEWPVAAAAEHRRMRDSISATGIRYLGSFENLTVSRVYPQHRTLCDSYRDAEATTCIVAYQLDGRWTFECSSEAADGRLLVTSNAALDKLAAPPGVLKSVLPADTAPEQVFRHHHEWLSALHATEPQLSFLETKTLDAVLQGCQRHSRRLSEHRQALGLMTEAEFLAAVEDPDKLSMARRIWREFQRARGNASAGSRPG